MAKFYLNIKFYGTINDPLPVLPGNEQDLGHESIVNTYLFYQVCKTFLPKTGVLNGSCIITKSLPNLWQNFNWDTSFRRKCLKLRCHGFLHWQIGLLNRQCYAPCTLGKTSGCRLCFHDQDLPHCLVKQARDNLWCYKIFCLNKTLQNIW